MAAARDTRSVDPLFKGEWSNQRCIDIAFSKAFPAVVKDLTVQKNIISCYLNFYLGGKVQKGLSVSDLAFAVISIMPLHEETERFIWEDIHYKEGGTMFFLTPEDKLKAEVGKIDINGVIKPNERVKGEQKKIQEEKRMIIETDYLKNPVIDKDDELENNADGEAGEESGDSNDEVKITPTVFQGDRKRSREFENILTDNTPSPSASSSEENKIPIQLPENVKWFSRAPKKKEAEQNPPHYGPAENSAFVASCNKLLEKWDTDEKARIVLKYFFGIAALILMRATTKKFPHLVNTFASYKFLSTISFTIGYLKYSVPHKKCFKNSYRNFSKRDGNTPFMFAKIVVNSFHIDVLRREKKMEIHPKLNILKLAILSHTADYGFGIITILQNIASKASHFDFNVVLKVTYCDRTAESWNRITTFMKTYMATTSKQATHHWARIISPEFFKDLSCNSNFALSVILGVFIEKITNSSDIWQSAWTKTGDDEHFLSLIKTGQSMYVEYENKTIASNERQ